MRKIKRIVFLLIALYVAFSYFTGRNVLKEVAMEQINKHFDSYGCQLVGPAESGSGEDADGSGNDEIRIIQDTINTVSNMLDELPGYSSVIDGF